MLLADFVGRAQITLDPDRQTPVDLHQVRAFVFGEYYLISMRSGKSYDVRELDDILSVMHDEFSLWKEQWVPGIEIVNWGKPGINGKTRVLQVTAEPKGTFLPPPPVEAKVALVRQAVTMFNIGGSWDQFEQGNL
jgi:hypothetical protein